MASLPVAPLNCQLIESIKAGPISQLSFLISWWATPGRIPMVGIGLPVGGRLLISSSS